MVVLISGKKEARKQLGYVADFCPVCHSLSTFVLSAVGTGDHIYFVSLGLTHTSGHLKSCTVCGVELPAVLNDYAGTARQADELEHLIELTHPQVRTRRATELVAAAKFAASPQQMSDEDRAEYLFRLLKLFNPKVEHRYARRFDFDGQSSAGCLTTVVLVVFLFQRSCSAGKDGQPLFQMALWTLLAGFAVTIIQVLLAPGRFMRRRVAPGVFIGAGMIHAKEEEIDAALKRAWSLGLLIGKKLRPGMLTALILSCRRSDPI